MTLGEFVNGKMQEQGLNQADLARKTGFSTAYVNMICNGKVKQPMLDKAKIICDALGCTIDELAVAMYGNGA